MASHLNFSKIPFGAARLSQDIATLINNRQGSDVQFKVGGGYSTSTHENGETIYDESTTVTLYAHSLILRCRSSYFATMLDQNKDWMEKSSCTIYKPEISPTTLQNVLHYIYTGDIQTKNSDNIIELITVAEEMGLEELSIEYQSEFIRTVKSIFFDDECADLMTIHPVDVAIRTHIIPALNLGNSHSLSDLTQNLLTIMLPRMSVIIKSPDAYTTFINGISSESLVKVISSDDLAMTEHSIWDLTLSWACYQKKLLKTAVEAQLNSIDDDEDDEKPSDDGTIINDIQLSQLKKILTPLLPAIRFSLLDREDYRRLATSLSYFLSRRRFSEINQFFLNPDGMGCLDSPRKDSSEQKIRSDFETMLSRPPPVFREPEKAPKPIRKVRCKHWPRCSNKKCKFIHPRLPCRYDKYCQHGDKCTYIHSSDGVSNGEDLEPMSSWGIDDL